MAGLITVRLSRSDAQPWGFRLQGGKDFGAPLLIQKVNGGSIAEKAGLQVADAVIKVNGHDVYNLRHKEAQDAIVKAGSSFEVVVSRGPGGTWKPAVAPVGNLPSPSPVGGAPSAVTKTSLAYKGPASPAIGSGHNVAARPFSATPQLNGVGDQGSVKSITSKQYNSPVALYSEQTIAETLSAQAEVLAGGVLGVNFMKNEKTYTANNSEVLKAVQEIDAEPRDPEPVEPVIPGGGIVAPPPVSGLRHVTAPETKPPSTTSPQPALQPGQNICADCERLIVGVFVRIKDKNLHVECFKCATCGTSLKNVGYYNINNKLYCDVHAKLVARSNPPAPNLDPITIPQGGRIPSGVVSAPAPSVGPQSPQPGTLGPLPFHPPTSNISGPKPFGTPAAAPAPFSIPAAPVSAPAPAPAPLSSVPFSPAPPPAPAPFSAPAPPPFSSFPKNLPESSLTSSQSQTHQESEDISCTLDKSKRMSVCSTEVSTLSEKKGANKALTTLMEDPSRASPIPFIQGGVTNESFSSTAKGGVRQSENVETSEEGNVHVTRKTKVEESFVRSQKMYTAEMQTSSLQSSVQGRAASPELEQILAKRQIYQSIQDSSRLTPNTLLMQQKKTQSERCLTPEIEHLMDKPHGNWSPMPAACFVRPISPSQIISYPPNIPVIPTTIPPPRTATPEQFQEARETVERFVDHTKHTKQSHTTSADRSVHSNVQLSSLSSYTQQYSPRYDMSQGFSAYQGRSNQVNNNGNPTTHNNGNPGNHINGNPGNHSNGNPGNHSNGNSGNHANGNPGNYSNETSGNGDNRNTSKSNGNPDNNGNGAPGNGNKGDEPTVTEPDDFDERFSRKSSKTDHSQKSSRKTSGSEEESSRRVFTDFGGPQVSSTVEVESVTEGGVQTTSVKKSEKVNYSSCEFESSRKSSVLQDGQNITVATGESLKQSFPKFTAESSIDEEEMVTKSQVEEIIKQELNKVFQMAQTMEKTNFGEMYENKSEQQTSQVVNQSSAKTSEQKHSSSDKDKIAVTDKVITKTGKLTSGLTIAPERSFTPQPLESNYPLSYQNMPSNFPPARSLPQPPPEKPGYIPLTGDRDSPFLNALTIASDRPYSPLPIATAFETPSFITATKKSSMLDALTTAPKTPFHIEGVSSITAVDESEHIQKKIESKYETAQKYAPRPAQSDFKPISSITVEQKPPTFATKQTSDTCAIKSFPPVTDELKSAFKSTSKVQSSSFVESEKQQAESSRQSLQTSQQMSSSARVERPLTPSGLHPPNLLPYYQQNIGEIPLAHRANSPVPHQIKAPSITPPRAQSVPRQGERRGSVKAMSDAYTQQVVAQNNKQDFGSSSVSYVSSGAYSTGSVTKTYSYEQEHKSIDAMGYHASPLAGKLPLAGEPNLPKCSSPLLGKLDHTKQVFKPVISAQQPTSAFQSPVAEQANLRSAAPYFVQEKEKPQAPWVVMKEKGYEENVNMSSFKTSQLSTQPAVKPSLPHLPLPNVNKTQLSFPEPPKPFSLPGVTKPPSAIPDAGPGGAAKGGTTAGTTAPRRGRGVLNTAVSAGGRVPLCGSCNSQIRGPFITALGKIWCPDHFVCVNGQCRRPLQDIGFVEDAQGLYCEFCFEQYLAPTCNKCNAKVKGDCLNAIGKHFHPECFTCAYCGKLFGNSPFFLEDALPYCETDWNELFTTKCFSCGFPIEAGDRWVEALNNNYHSQCFNCTMCKKNLEGQSFFAKGGRPFCKTHAR